MRASETDAGLAECAQARSEVQLRIDRPRGNCVVRTIQRLPRLRVAPPGIPGLASLGRHFSPETTLGFFPGDHRNSPSIDLAQTLLYFIQPSLLGAFVYLLVEARKQGIGQRGTPLWRKQQRILQKLGGIFPHTPMILPNPGRDNEIEGLAVFFAPSEGCNRFGWERCSSLLLNDSNGATSLLRVGEVHLTQSSVPPLLARTDFRKRIDRKLVCGCDGHPASRWCDGGVHAPRKPQQFSGAVNMKTHASRTRVQHCDFLAIRLLGWSSQAKRCDCSKRLHHLL